MKFKIDIKVENPHLLKDVTIYSGLLDCYVSRTTLGEAYGMIVTLPNFRFFIPEEVLKILDKIGW